MLESIKLAVAWLSLNIDPAVPRALLIALVFAAVYAIRKLFPRAWEWFARAVPVPVIDPAPLLLLLSKAWQALPAALLGGVATALTTGGDVTKTVKGVVFGALAALAHEFVKAVPWIPYRGATGKLKPPVLPMLYLLGLGFFCVLQPGITGCGAAAAGAELPPCTPASHERELELFNARVAVACVAYDTLEECPDYPDLQRDFDRRIDQGCGQ